MVARPYWAESSLGRCRPGDEQTWAEVCFTPCWEPAHDGHKLAPGVSPASGLPGFVRTEAALASQLGKLPLTICS